MKNIVFMLVISLVIPVSAGATIQDIQVYNNTSAAVTISWITDSDTKGEVHYSKNDDLSNHSTGYDVRGQVFEGCTHHINITNLTKETTYYFEVVSGDEIDNNNGSYYTFKTMKETFPPGRCLVYGNVYHEDGTTAAVGAMVYLRLNHDGVDSYPLSDLLSPNDPTLGYFLFNIKEARSVETNNIFSSITPGDPIHLEAVYGGNYTAHNDLVFIECTYNYGSMTLGYSTSSTTTPITTSTAATSTVLITTSTTAPTTVSTTTSNTIPTTVLTTAPTTTPTTIPIRPTTTSTTTVSSTSTTTTVLSTTTLIPTPECEVTINPPSAKVLPWGTLKFSAITSCDEKEVIGTYKWYVDSTKGSRIDENGLYKAGAFAETVTVTVVDTANGDTEATAEVTISPLWPMAYDKMWGVKKGENLSILRAFRDEVLADSEVGRDYIFMLYGNSLEILILFTQNPSLIEGVKEIIDELLPGIQSLLDGSEMILSKKQQADIELLITRFEIKASPGLKTAIRKVKKDINRGEMLKQLGITIGK